MKRSMAPLVFSVVLVLFLASSGDRVQAQSVATVTVSQHAELGPILSDGSGNTLYLFTRDERNVSNCSGGCANTWPPLLTDGDPQAGDGLGDALGTVTRGDGGTQVAYNGWPLYYFASDESPGDAKGQDVGDRWYVVGPDGGPVQSSVLVETSAHADLGTIITDRSGRSLYLFTPDERNVSNCAGPCALAWPPLLTIGDPQGGEGVADRLGTITRADGSSQVAYNGRPLYYFAFDGKPGDTNGQDSRDVWYVVGPDGGPIQSTALVETSENAEFGTILTDRSGRTLYLFTPDGPDASNCAGGCALAWPPLLTVGDPSAGDGAAADQLGTFARADGSTQVSYNQLPLYYFAADQKPGDTRGQNVGGVWFVVSSDGEAVTPPTPPSVGDDLLPRVVVLAALLGVLLLAGGIAVWRRERRALSTA